MKTIHILLFSLAVASCVEFTSKPTSLPRHGAPGQDNVAKPKYNDLAWHPATAAINKNLKGQNKTATVALVPVKVRAARVQVVAGILYQLDIEVGESKCKIETNATATTYTAKKCPLTGSGDHQLYRVTIFSQPWAKKLEATKVIKLENDSRIQKISAIQNPK